MNGEINRTLIVNGPLKLSEILIKEGINNSKNFRDFSAIVIEYLQGCKCITDPYYELMVREYNRLSGDSLAIKELSDRIKANIILKVVE